MTKDKRLVALQIAYDQIQKIHHELCVAGKTEVAEKTFDIQRRIILLALELQKSGDEPLVSCDITTETMAAINAIGRKTHREV